MRPEAADSACPSTPDTCPAKNRFGRAFVCQVSASTVGPLMYCSVNHAEPDELRVLEAGNHAQDAGLLGPFQLRLKSDEAEMIPGELSCRNCTTAYGVRPVPGSIRPTGFIGPKRSVSTPRCAMTSIGRQPSKNFVLSKSWTAAFSAVTIAS